MNDYPKKQLELINKLEENFRKGQSSSTIVEPVQDYVNDNRICFTSVTFIPTDLGNRIVDNLIIPLQQTGPHQYFYLPNSFHVTINNIRKIKDPPSFNNTNIEKAQKVFRKVVPRFHSFTFELKRLFELPTSLAISAFSDETLANLALALRDELKKAGIPDDKTYADDNIVIASATIARFTKEPNLSFRQKVKELKEIEIGSFVVKKVSLITTNAVCHPAKTKIIEEYFLN